MILGIGHFGLLKSPVMKHTHYFLLALLVAAGCTRRESTSDPVPLAAVSPTGVSPSPYAAGALPVSAIDLRQHEVEPFLTGFWPQPNPDSRWTVANRVEIRLAEKAPGPTTLTLITGCFLVPGKLDRQRVSVSANGKLLGTLELDNQSVRNYTLKVPAGVWTGNNKLVLDLPDAESPVHLGAGKDDRQLALALQSIKIEPIP